MPSGRDRTVVLVAHHTQRVQTEPWLRLFADDRVHVVAPDEAPEWRLGPRDRFWPAGNAHATMRSVRQVGPVDVMVVLPAGPLLPEGAGDQLELFRRLFRFLRPRGAYVVDRSCAAPDTGRDVRRWLDLLAAAEQPTAPELLRTDAELAKSVAAVAVTRDLVVVTKRLHHLVKLREDDVNEVLLAREPATEVRDLDRVQPGDLRSRANVAFHGATAEPADFPGSLPYPAVTLRHYRGQIALSGRTLMYTGSTILPDSFRWHLTPRTTNPMLVAQSSTFARVPHRAVPRRTLKGDYYQLESAFPGHFGHIMTEVASRLWGWDRAKAELPGLKALVHTGAHAFREPALEAGLFEAFGIDQEDVVWVNEPVWLESVVSATPMWHNERPYYVHPRIQDVWHRVGDGLLRGHPAEPSPARLFVSRRSSIGNRPCRNAAEVEAVFERHGFRVVFPEQHSLAEQAALFRDAQVVAGFAGSGMFNVLHTRSMRTMIVLSHEAYWVRNEHLFASVLGGDVHYFWSRPDVEAPPDARSRKALQSGWEFDFPLNGRALQELLETL